MAQGGDNPSRYKGTASSDERKLMLAEQSPAAIAGTIALGDLQVNRLGFGAMRITGPGIWGEPPDRQAARRLMRRVVELGIDFIDTADSYGPAVSEELIAEALHPYPEGLTIATKGGFLRSGPGKWDRDARPAHLREACEASLRRLRLDAIPLYQLHAVDPNVPLEESVGALADLQRQGKIRHIGLSNVDVGELRRAQQLAPIVSVQNRYNVFERNSDAVLDVCEQEHMAFLPWAPVRRGMPNDPPVIDAAAEAAGLIANARGLSVQQLMIAWLLARSPATLPIPGTSSVAHLEENVAATAVRLTPDELERLEAASSK
jgi:aryl-alcohol dehydrogenase-like predicted oxidoreductase